MAGTENPPFCLENVTTHTAQLFRLAVGSLVGTTGGVIGDSDLTVTANTTPNMSVNVAAGGCWVPGTTLAPQQGSYFCYSDALTNVAVAAADATNPRIDIAVAIVQDSQYAGGFNVWSLAVVEGIAAATPVAPAVPTSAIELAAIQVPANATAISSSDITDMRSLASSSLNARQNPAARLYASAGQVTSQNVVTQLTTLSEDWSTGIVVSGSGLEILTPGAYRATASISVNVGNAGEAVVGYIGVNGATERSVIASAAATDNVTCVVTSSMKLIAGDVVTAWVNATSSAATVRQGSDQTWLELELISRS